MAKLDGAPEAAAAGRAPLSISAPARRIKVLVVGPTPPPCHGVATFTRDLLENAHDPCFELLHLDTSDRRDAANIGTWDLGNLRLGFANLAELAACCVRTRPDIVYVPISQNIPAFLRDALFILQARTLGRRLVLHLHGGYFRTLYEGSNAAFRALARVALKRAAAVIVLGEEFRPIFKGLVPDQRVHVVENGVPDSGAWQLRISSNEAKPPGAAPEPENTAREAKSPEPGAKSQDPLTILYMGTLTRTKGILELTKALALLRASRTDVRLRVAGQWQEQGLRAEAEELVAREHLGAQVEFVGNVAGQGKAAFLASGDIFCLPTRYPYEGQPLVILEAMAAGLPVLSTEHGAIGSTVANGVTGRLLPKEASPERLAATLGEMLAEPAALQAYGRRGRERYLERYTLEACHRRLRRVFAAVAGAP